MPGADTGYKLCHGIMVSLEESLKREQRHGLAAVVIEVDSSGILSV